MHFFIDRNDCYMFIINEFTLLHWFIISSLCLCCHTFCSLRLIILASGNLHLLLPFLVVCPKAFDLNAVLAHMKSVSQKHKDGQMLWTPYLHMRFSVHIHANECVYVHMFGSVTLL